MNITKHNPQDAYDLLFPKYLSMLSDVNQDTMIRAIRNSTHVWIGTANDNVFGFWGLIAPTLLGDTAYLWFYSTEYLPKCTYAFIRHSRRVTRELLEHYPVLVGHGKVGAERSLRWLKWCGAQFGEPQGDLIPFEIKAS